MLDGYILRNINSFRLFNANIYMCILNIYVVKSAGAVEYADYTSAVRYDYPITSVLHMTLNNLMVRVQ